LRKKESKRENQQASFALAQQMAAPIVLCMNRANFKLPNLVEEAEADFAVPELPSTQP
jgi:hypothetical protein